MNSSILEIWEEAADAQGCCPGQSYQVVLVDAVPFMQGLDGAKGEKGDSGEKGDHGDAGPAVSRFPVSHFWPSAETCLTVTIPMPRLFLI